MILGKQWIFQYIGDDDGTQFVYDVYEETCMCDTPFCNVRAVPLNFFCNEGDFDRQQLLENTTLLEKTISCYTNRKQCFIMVYEGKHTCTDKDNDSAVEHKVFPSRN